MFTVMEWQRDLGLTWQWHNLFHERNYSKALLGIAKLGSTPAILIIYLCKEVNVTGKPD